MNGTVRGEVFSLRGGLWFGTYHLLNYPASYSAPLYRFCRLQRRLVRQP